jgi:hypothetical protein
MQQEKEEPGFKVEVQPRAHVLESSVTLLLQSSLSIQYWPAIVLGPGQT